MSEGYAIGIEQDTGLYQLKGYVFEGVIVDQEDPNHFALRFVNPESGAWGDAWIFASRDADQPGWVDAISTEWQKHRKKREVDDAKA